MATNTKMFVGCDHAGLPLKKNLLPRLIEAFPKIVFEDLGTFDETSVDYPDYAAKVASEVLASHGLGLLICGSGIGMAIAANKKKGIRAAQAWDVTSAKLSREHNDANVLCLGARLIGSEVAFEAAKIWLTTAFLGDRHRRRVEQLNKLGQS